MHTFKTAGMATLAAISLVQFCPAPPAIIATVAGGVLGGGISGGIGVAASKSSRDMFSRGLPAGVSQESVDQCTQQINAQKDPVHVYDTGDDSARADNVPAACMNLATVLLKEPAQAGGPVPTTMGSSSLEYHGLSAQDKKDLQQALSG
ncbi:hypothetical protein ASPWEDRAFT_170451 [Aspergillus wentii DTO 134E9]|uniref:Uncharacterized protein n=1 Tax=Aspergillus wentii DTO 134E9 TaxID=1073089 RepID=A0A1L9RPT9_ASPWE|nr:uncharacterized protein ASPWEDRAFT_170451 [Aspergillus wentii DTO 134E9]KAI9923916.1 hypothetical protein MW887_008221 [Aspergillus wentii]OJJ36949.1 hypothetical protein ASPWEDRAFT_170451 [Aspergillus wentii DTO 134E9]